MKTKILSGLICCLGIFSANAQTITAPVGQSLTVTNPIDITVAGGTMNVPSDGAFNIGGVKMIQYKNLNLSFGEGAGFTSGTGIQNIFIGKNSGYSNTSGEYNYFSGSNSGYYNTTGSYNSFFGTVAGFNNSTGSYNYFSGYGAGLANTTGGRNIFLGNSTGISNTVGDENSFFGVNAGYRNSTGSRNIMIGSGSGYYNTTGNDNTYIGSNIVSPPAINNATGIGANASVTASNTIVLGNAATTITGAGLGSGSGLRFANLTSASPAGVGGANKALSVDAAGNVILVGIVGATTTAVGGPVAENWKESDGYLYNNSTNGVVIKGTGLDGNSLIVKGGVLSKEVNVKVEGSESWPDYVFKPNYKRMTLGEVEKFISINGHLPNVPSATEMAKTGNNLGQTDVKLLEKVEELTLYLLDMKKANDAQAAELKALKQQVSKLRKK
jgi:trimeric autotransporter adhesin